ncbi:5'-methylthioadenosine/S-adenosylhomocysteine nucleosidase [Enterococcus plantarum]|uniref:adenosylhomocysteine nucleosidase n=1 Tax=Enterococcus plantarum TaxID=1077675 RepID=A0A2W4BIS2_9ENTE|nr:5'-methylthioadenosine/S-adenosylhomocysteine nucleosidase [Enterococcus plantarum]PZL76925.1 5'-methylthioadenosine/S-adenosylhomocysteine nucleosidase [Enterococcus plantarum]
MIIVIAAAMQEELVPFRDTYRIQSILKRGKTVIEEVLDQPDYSLFLAETGIGKANAAASASLLCEMIQPDVIINTGSAGGFLGEVEIGDVVYGTKLAYSDVDATGFDYTFGQVPQMPRDYRLSQRWLEIFNYLEKPSNYDLYNGLIVTSDSFMSESAFVTKVKEHFPEVKASDMESTAIAQVASFYDIPVLNIRGISDIVGSEAAESFEIHLRKAALHAFQETKRLIRVLVEDK